MKLIEFIPDTSMRQFIHKFIYIDNEFADLFFKVVPRNYPAILFIGPESGEWIIEINNKQHILNKETIYFAGLGFLPSSMKFTGKLRFWIGMLQPHVSGQIFNDSPKFFVNNVYEVDKVNSEIQNLNEQLWKFQDVHEAYLYLNTFFEKFLGKRKCSPYIYKALCEIQNAKGQTNIHEIAKKSFTSNRNLLREFVNHTGVNPKKYAAMIRFSTLLNEFMVGPKTNLDVLASKYNYYDISHLNKDARLFLGHPLSSKSPLEKGLNEPLF